MATTNLHSESVPATPTLTPSAEAFMRAFREFRRLDNAPGAHETPEYELAAYAYRGGHDCLGAAQPQTPDEAAIVAFEEIEGVLDGGFLHLDEKRDPDEAEALRRIQNAVRNLWRYHDRRGGEGVREFAEYIGAAERHDTVTWAAQNSRKR